jgi:hypothetical protein
MQEEIVPIFKNFRDSVYRFFPSRRDAAMELVDALSSNKTANSIVALSLSPLHRRNYCSITRVLWDEVIMKGKKGSKLSDYPLRLLRVQVCKESGEVLFQLFE